MFWIFQSTFNSSFQKRKVAWKLKEKSQKSTSHRIRWLFLHWHQGVQMQQPNQAEKQGRTSAVPFVHGAFQGDCGALPWAASTVHVQIHDSNQLLGKTSLSTAWEIPAKALNCCKSLLPAFALQLSPWERERESRPASSRARGWTCPGQIPGPRAATSSGMLSGFSAGSFCHPLVLGMAPDWRWLTDSLCWVGWGSELASLPQNHSPAGCKEQAEGPAMWKKPPPGPWGKLSWSQKPRWKSQRSLWAQKRIKWIYWVQRKARQKQGKKCTVFVSSAHCYSREKKYELQWTGKGFFWKCERKKILFVLILCCQIHQPGKEIARKGNWSSGETTLATGWCWRNSSFRLLCQGSSSDIWVKADCMMATLFRNHQTAQIHISAAM